MSVADLLVPNPYPLNVGAITTPSINANTVTANTVTVPGAMVATNTPVAKVDVFQKLNVNATAVFPPVDIVCLAPNNDLAVRFLNAAVSGEVGVNATEPNPSTFLTASNDLKFLTNGAEQLRIKAAGITDFPTATDTLVINGTDLRFKRSDSGAFTPVWTTTMGFTGGPTSIRAHYMRNGNIVSMTLVAGNVGVAVGSNTATITLPFPPAAPFAVGELTGIANAETSVSSQADITPTLGSTTASVHVVASVAEVAPDISASFMYQIA